MTETGSLLFLRSVLNHECVRLLADAIERAWLADRAAVTKALADRPGQALHALRPDEFVNGQNTPHP